MGTINPALFSSMEWRSIGPHRGGRVVAVAGDPVDPMAFYFGACAGGLWKSTDGGTYWRNVSDGFFNTSAVGAVAVSDSDPNVVYVGMGEACLRGNVCHGDGVYRSTDGGGSWTHLGLEDTRHIARVRVHPGDPDLVYVAAMGHAFGSNDDRGVFRSKNGGKSWEKILFKSSRAGATDLSMDPNNPRILFAAIYQAQRYPWIFVSGGPDSGLHKSTDGGDTWTDITDNPGLPGGLKGRIGVAVSPAKEGRVWAMIEAEDGGLFRSDDGGETWEQVSDNPDIRGRPWYYSHVFADPQDAETVYILEGSAYRSVDGGRNFTNVQTPHGDNHDLWIDPHNPKRMIEGHDGGACVSYNAGASWSTIYNQPTAQFYHVTTDNGFPYRVYGAQQDNTTMSLPSRSITGAISQANWHPVGGGESGYIAVHPTDPDVVYAGNHSNGYVSRYNHRTGQVHNVMVWPESSSGWGAKDMRYRFQWTFPILFSPHNPNVLYVTGNHVFRSTDQGSSWEEISPDLTRNDVTKMEVSGGPISLDGTNAEFYCTVFAFAESPVEQGILWAGSDDGLVHVSRNGGDSWQDVTPPNLPEWALISIIEPSPHDAATAYVAATRYKLDDLKPYLYMTNDFGKTWQKIVNGIPEEDFTRVVREDPERRGLLYAGTEYGAYISFDNGANWQSLRQNLPVVPIHDLAVKNGDLVAATHGRSFWIMDDLTPLRQATQASAESLVHLFEPRTTYRLTPPETFGVPSRNPWGYERTGTLVVAYDQHEDSHGRFVRNYLDGGGNPPQGVVVSYYLAEKPESEVSLTFLDSTGTKIVRYRCQGAPGASPPSNGDECGPAPHSGMNRFVWNMRYPKAATLPGDPLTERLHDPALTGPTAPPGSYSVQLKVGEQTFTQPLAIEKAPGVEATQADMEAQFAFLMEIRDKLSETHIAVKQIRSIRRQVEEWTARTEGQTSGEPVAKAAGEIKEKLAAIEGELVQYHARSQIDRLKYPSRLNGKLTGLLSWVTSSDEKPTKQSVEVYNHLSKQVDAQVEALRKFIETDLEKFNSLISELEVPPLTMTPAG